MRPHGWLGLALLLGAEILLYAGSGLVATWFTPIMWTGYIVFTDALIAHRAGRSWLTTRRREFGFLGVLSVLSWLVFEVYNFKLKNWVYVGVPEQMWVRNIGFFWSFATITPAIFQTAGLLEAFYPHPSPPPPREVQRWERGWGGVTVLLGLALVAIPPALPDDLAAYTFGFVWLGFVALLEPVNLRLGLPSQIRGWREGNKTRLWLWLAAGFICGLLWEAWNYQSLSQGGAGWLYTMPELIHNLIFGLHYGKMPLAGLLGFPPFALECFAIYYFLRWVLQLEHWLPAEE